MPQFTDRVEPSLIVVPSDAAVMVRFWVTVTLPEPTDVVKPRPFRRSALPVMLRSAPLPVVRVTLCTLVSTFFAVTFTPETAAPVASVTVPRIEVDVVCANSSAQTRSNVTRNKRLFMLIPSREVISSKSILSGRLCQYKQTGDGMGA